MKGLFTAESSLKTAISNATSTAQLEQAFLSFGETSQLKTDVLTLANYVSTLCGTTTTTTGTLP